MENKPKIKWKNFKIWITDQFKRKTWFRNFFITRNAWEHSVLILIGINTQEKIK